MPGVPDLVGQRPTTFAHGYAMKALRRLRAAAGLLAARRIAHDLIAHADQARDNGRFAEAAPLYDAALRILPHLAAIHVQAGHMRKEIGEFDAALAHYRRADELMPGNADLALQFGHLFHRANRSVEAIAAYRHALRLDPEAADAVHAIAAIKANQAAKELERGKRSIPAGLSDDAKEAWSQALEAGLLPELMPEHAVPRIRSLDQIVLWRAGGRVEAGPWGELPTIHRIGAVRGFLVSRQSFGTVTITLDGRPIRTEQPCRRQSPDRTVEHVFNMWIDTAERETGCATLGISFFDGDVSGPSTETQVMVAGGIAGSVLSERDDIIPLAPGDPSELDDRVRMLPSEIRRARSNAVQTSIRSILVLRADQLGDLVVSLPALMRLREVTGGAKLIGLLTPANAELAASLGIFDDIVVADFPFSPVSRDRVMSAKDQAALREHLHEYAFDAAIDLGTSHMSRPLLVLSGAQHIYGVETGLWRWLDVRLGKLGSRSAVEERRPHSERLLGMVDQFAKMIGATSARPVLRREDDDRSYLARFNLAPRTYVVVHEAIGHRHNHWPGFTELLRLLLVASPLDIVFLTENPARGGDVAATDASTRIRLFDHRLPFDELDALLANAAAFVGIDSGPKHLAALRGVPVVSIHASRSDWLEWGQEQTGLIVSRRVPCAGCGIGHDDNACGKGFACMVDIRADEVASCVLSLLATGGISPPSGSSERRA